MKKTTSRSVVTLILLVVSLSACDINVAGPTVNNSNTNTNSNNASNDSHDANFAPSNPSAPTTGPTGEQETVLPLPSSAQGLATSVVNPLLLAKSCQDVYGEAAWQFMDTIVGALRKSDARWGYLVKANTGQVSHDVIAYRATSDNIGAWGVDIIIDYCGHPSFGWGVIGFDPAAQWTGTRF